MLNYIAIIHKEENSEYGVSFPDFHGCVTSGKTIDEAKNNAIEVLNFHIEGMRKDNEDIPTASTLEQVITTDDYIDSVAILLVEAKEAYKNVRVNITMRADDLRTIDAAATAAGMNRSVYLVNAGLNHAD